MSRNSSQFAFVLVAGTVLVNLASAAGSWAGGQEATASIRFRGTSTLHDFEGSAEAEPFVLEIQRDSATRQPVIRSSVRVPVIDMTTHHRKRDKSMNDMLDGAHYAVIEGAMNHAVVPLEGEGVVKMRLRIRDQEHEVDATFSNWRDDGDSGSFRLSFPVSLKAFGLKPPSVLGVIRVGDEVQVECMIQWPARVAQLHAPGTEADP